VRLAAGCDPDAERRRKFAAAQGVPVYADIEALLAAERPDIVSICSPAAAHAAQVRACLAAGVPMVWLEKPPVAALAELDALIQAAAAASAAVLVNYQRRYEPAYRLLRQACQGTRLGALRHLEITYSRGLRVNGVHLLDILFYLLGDPGTFQIAGRDEPADPDHPCFHIAFEGGIRASVTGIAGLPYHNIDVTATFEGGRLAVLHGGLALREELRVEHERYPGFYRLREAPQGLVPQDPGDNLGAALADLMDAHETGRAPASNLRTAGGAQRVLDMVLAAPRGTAP
jgi:predicted dehydrogenase